MNIPATSNSRSDDQIKADSEKDKGLEAGTMRDANGVPRNMRQFPPAPIETYAQYLARVSGLTDFTPLNEVQWRTETGQKTAEEMILADLGITTKAPGQVFCQKNMINFWQMPLVEVKVPLDTPVIDGTVETFPVVKELDIADYLNTAVSAPDLKAAGRFHQGVEDLMAGKPTSAAEEEARNNATTLPVEEN